jgi:hypothetical protein
MPRQRNLPISRDVVVRKVPTETLELLAEAAEREGTTREGLIRSILEKWVEENTEPA